MSNPARARLAGRIEVEMPDDARQAAIPCFEADERRHEREVLDRLAKRLGRGERAVAGSHDVLAMLERWRAWRRCSTTSATNRASPGVLEQAIEDAVGQSAEVLPLRHHPDELAQHGHIAAVLRF